MMLVVDCRGADFGIKCSTDSCVHFIKQLCILQMVLETKSGPIQCLTVHDVTRFYHNDLIVGNSCGMLTMFCNQQILSRQSLSPDSIICVTVTEDNGKLFACKIHFFKYLVLGSLSREG